MFGGAALGDPRIVVREVESAHPVPRLAGAPVDAPLRLRVLARDGLACSGRGLVLTPEARTGIARDAAADVAALLASGATVDGAPLRPGDVAVLVRTNDQGTVIRDALAAVGVPAVLSGTTSVFGTPAAREWLTLLHALEQLRPIRIRDAALTCFLGRSVAELCGAGGDDDAADALLDDLGATLRRWAAVLRGKGVAALLEAVTTGTGLPGRLLGVADGERRLTDVRHVGQALHAAAVDAHLGPAALVEWLRHRIDEAAADVGLERSRRLDSDAAAVQVITVHRSKGLEFPVVYVPFGWDRVRAPRARRAPAARRRGRARPRRRRGGRAALVRALRAPRGGGGGRGPPAAVRGADPGALPGGDVVGAGDDRAHLAAAPAAVRAARPGRDPARVVPGPERRGAR